MFTLEEIINPANCIVHFTADDAKSAAFGQRIIYYQVHIDPNQFSPVGDFIRFTQSTAEAEEFRTQISEIHGWVLVEDIIIDEILEQTEVQEVVNG
jgi:hypothetical protein